MDQRRHVRQVVIDGHDLRSWDAFHDVFARELRFFDGYGRNMDAWIDCMSSLDEDVAIHIRNFEHFARASPDLSSTLLECTAAVNQRYEEWDGRPHIAIVPM